MRRVLLCVFGTWLLGAVRLCAQQLPVAAEAPSPPLDLPADHAPTLAAGDGSFCDLWCGHPSEPPPRFWARGEHLLWWVKDAPIPVPLVTTGDPNVGFGTGVPIAGALGQPGTRVLFGNSPVDLGTFSGLRLTAGAWLDDERTIGFEGSGFLLEHRQNQFGAASDPTGNPPLYFAVFNVVDGAERALLIADPLQGFAGAVAITNALRLWGAEANGLARVWGDDSVQLSLLGGFRFVSLSESLDIVNPSTDLVLLNTTVASERFATQNQFYGGQLGARLSGAWGGFTGELTAKVALGETHQVVGVGGVTTQTALAGGTAPTPGTFPGGTFALPSNMGRSRAAEFTVIPAVELKVGYQLTSWLSGFVGYDCLYWNRVVRPGDQIDRNINPTQSAGFGGTGGVLAGPASPQPLFNRTEVWAQGISFGLELRF